VHEARPMKADQSWFTFIRKTKSPELPVVLLEDFGALIGLVIALAAVSLTTITGNADFDGIGTIAIGVLLVLIAIVLAREMKSLLIGEAASDADIDAMTSAIDAAPYVERLINLRSEHIGPDELLVAAKIEFTHELTVPQLADAIDEVEVRVRAAVPTARRLFIEPDIHRAARAAAGE
jgi:divalent metal cation (Fe/Co/Zn/Cd) transporter